MKFAVAKIPQTQTEIDSLEYIYVQDSEDYVFKKLVSEISSDEKIISEKEYMKKSGISSLTYRK